MIFDSHSSEIKLWRCPNCGQTFFTTHQLALPHKCGICRQSIQWVALNKRVQKWKCPNCGQTLFTDPNDSPPDMCDYCHDMTTWIEVDD